MQAKMIMLLSIWSQSWSQDGWLALYHTGKDGWGAGIIIIVNEENLILNLLFPNLVNWHSRNKPSISKPCWSTKKKKRQFYWLKSPINYHGIRKIIVKKNSSWFLLLNEIIIINSTLSIMTKCTPYIHYSGWFEAIIKKCTIL